jgi:hypothetical protein
VNGKQTRICQKVKELCYGGVKPEETQACSAEGVTGGVTEEQNKPFITLTSEGWWALVSVIVIISIVVLIVLKLSKRR